MNKKRLLCIILTLAAAVSLVLIRDSAAWINTRTGEPLREQLQIQKMNMDFRGTLRSCYIVDGDQTYMIAGQNLIWDNGGKITGTNYSTIDTELRVRVEYDTLDDQNVVCSGGTDELLLATFADGWTYEDGYFYKSMAPVSGSATSVDFDILNHLEFNDDENQFSREDYIRNGTPLVSNVRVLIQAKQADNVTWADLAAITTP